LHLFAAVQALILFKIVATEVGVFINPPHVATHPLYSTSHVWKHALLPEAMADAGKRAKATATTSSFIAYLGRRAMASRSGRAILSLILTYYLLSTIYIISSEKTALFGIGIAPERHHRPW
jgi:hypothetical protein